MLSYTVARPQCAKLIEVAVELGLHNHTLSRWLGEKRAATKFVQVVARPAAAALLIASWCNGDSGVHFAGIENVRAALERSADERSAVSPAMA